MTPTPTGQLLDQSLEKCLKTRIPEYYDWLEFGNSTAPYSKHTIKAYKSEIKLFLSFIGEIGVESALEVNNAIIRQYLSEYSKKGAKPTTISQKLSCIDSFFEWLYLEGFTEYNPISKFKQTLRRSGRGGRKETKMPTVLFPDEVQRIFLHLNKSDSKTAVKSRAMIGLILDTGLRASEFCQIRIQDAKNLLKTGTIKVRGKGNKERVIHSREAYHDYLSDYLDNLFIDHQDGVELNARPLFLTTHGNPIKQENLYSMINGILKKLGIHKEQNGAHLLRHTAASMMLHEGRNIKDVQLSLGHSSIQTTSLYTHLVATQ
jgi:site-specific recombinase XerD